MTLTAREEAQVRATAEALRRWRQTGRDRDERVYRRVVLALTACAHPDHAYRLLRAVRDLVARVETPPEQVAVPEPNTPDLVVVGAEMVETTEEEP